MPNKPCVHIVEDDLELQNSLRVLLRSTGMECTLDSSAEELLGGYEERADDWTPRCALIDLILPGMSGLDLQMELHRRQFLLPVLIITGHATISSAVQALKRGAFDYLEKPLHGRLMLEQIGRAIDEDRRRRPALLKQRLLQTRLKTLTPREREVLDLMLLGKSNKKLAHELGISTKTASKHSSRVLLKLGIENIVELTDVAGQPMSPIPDRIHSAEISGSARGLLGRHRNQLTDRAASSGSASGAMSISAPEFV